MGWLELRRALDGSDPDQLAFRRGPEEFRNSALTELPKGDWALTMLRQYFFDAWEALWQDAARGSSYAPLAQAAALALREEKFHLQHTALWVERLSLGTPESGRRVRQALAELFGPTHWACSSRSKGEQAGGGHRTAARPSALKVRWLTLVTAHLTRCGLTPPDAEPVARGIHTEHLAPLLSEFQQVARQHPELTAW